MTENVAYNPEQYGLSTVGTVELSGYDWEFDELMVLHGEQGYYLATGFIFMVNSGKPGKPAGKRLV